MHSPDEFWRGRLARSGHTGWNDPVVYAYDQLERLACVAAELDRLEIRRGHALDFGCGTGDFSRQLLARGLRVSGYDPYVRPPIADPAFQYLRTLDELAAPEPPWDLVLSVTVLDHVLDAGELRGVLARLRSGIARRGRLLMLEYSLDASEERGSDYQAFRSLKSWREALADSGFRIARVAPVPHPEQSPSSGYRSYARRWPARLIQRSRRRLPFVQPLLAPLLPWLARRDFERFGLGRVASSPLKLHVCEPR